MARLVLCKKLGRELPGLETPPFAGELGERIYDQISAEAFALWQRHAGTLIASYGLNLADPQARAFLQEQMEAFFFGEQAQMPDWFGEAGPAGAGKSAKGGGAPARKK